jgi:hypothetical protein
MGRAIGNPAVTDSIRSIATMSSYPVIKEHANSLITDAL